jgi:hypothetical protein
MNRDFVQEPTDGPVDWAFRNAACFRHPDETVWCWGDNSYGQLGNPHQPNQAGRVSIQSPLQVVTADGEPLAGVRDIAIASDHGCAVTQDEQLYCWGSNYAFQLGFNGDHTPYAIPVPHNFTAPIRAVAVSTYRLSRLGTTCLIDGDYRVQCFGLSERRVEGLPIFNLFLVDQDEASWDITDEPTQVPGMGQGHRLALSPTDLCIRRQDGTTRCRGMNIWGAVGLPGALGTSELNMLRMARTIETWGNTADLFDLSQHVGCARRLDGTIRCAGHTHGGLLGNGYLREADQVPVQPIGLSAVRQVAVGMQHVCALQTDGEVLCWGHNSYGIIGANHPRTDGTCWANSAMNEDEFQSGTDCYQEPQNIDAAADTLHVASGLTSVCGVTANRRVWCRGAINADTNTTNFNELQEDRWVGLP